MTKFVISVRQVVYQGVLVEAETENEAINKVDAAAKEGSIPFDNDPDYEIIGDTWKPTEKELKYSKDIYKLKD